MRKLLTTLGALAIFAALSVSIFGTPLIARGFATSCFGGYTGEPQIYMWGLAWYPHAISHRLVPLETSVVWAPSGFNLAWATTIPGASLAAWPLTRIVGVVASYNVLTLLAPILASFTAFVLYRYVTGAFWPALIGGGIFGFSPYMQEQLTGHLDLVLVFVIPILPWLVLLHWHGRLGRITFVMWFAACLVFQFLLSPEIFATATIFGALAIVAARRFFPEINMAEFKRAAVSLTIAYGVAIVVLSPYLVRFLARQYDWLPIYNPAHCSTDLLNFFFPTGVSAMGAWLPSLNAVTIRNDDLKEAAGYLGLLPVLGALFLWRSPRRDLARYLTAMLALICIASIGPVLHVSGFGVAPWLWIWAVPVPILNNALPARFMMYAFLVGGLIVALWLAEAEPAGKPSPLRWLLAGAVVVSLMPAIPFSRWIGKADLPEFFRDGIYANYLKRDETVLILPYGESGNCMLWQSSSKFYFRMPQGLLGIVPHEFQAWPIVDALNKDAPYIPGYEDQFKAFIADHDVSAIVVKEGDYAAYGRLVSTVSAQRVDVGGVFLYRIDRESLAPYRSLGADEMESRYNLLRFRMLFGAAQSYLASGKPLDKLSPVQAASMGLPPEVVRDEPRSQVYGYWPISAIRRRASFQRIVSWIMRTVPLRYRLAQELGPAPKFAATTAGIWLGPWDDGAIAIGVVGTPQGLRSVLSNYGSIAEKIYFPYPAQYVGHLDGGAASPQLLLMVFAPQALGAIRTSAVASPAHAKGACTASGIACYAPANSVTIFRDISSMSKD